MSTLATIGVSVIFVACILYTIGVWAEKLNGRLKWQHVIIFWCGFIADTIGTGSMGSIAGGIFQVNFHAITGLIAIVLMLFHAVWATIVLIKKNEKLIMSFHKFSIVVWSIWLVPMVTGIVFGAVTGAMVK